MRIFALLCCCLALFVGCTKRPEPTVSAIVNTIPSMEYAVIGFGNQMERDQGLFLLDSRAYYDDDGFILVEMRFRTQKLVDVRDGRDLIVDLVEEFLERVNTDAGLTAYLQDSPFSSRQLVVNIEFESFYGKYIDPLYMGRIRLECGNVYYYANNALDPDQLRWDQRVEPYEKAFRFSRFRRDDMMMHRCEKKSKAYLREHKEDEYYDHTTSRSVYEYMD